MTAPRHPDSFDPIRAQSHALGVLRAAVARDRVASSYLFEGPPGVGKELAAVALAKAQLASRGVTSRELGRVDHGNHPDVRIFEPRAEGAGNLKVEYLREEILPLAQFAPFEAPCTFFVFPRADVSFPANHPEAANALLKTLEEPRPDVHFVLLAERPDRLLQTIRSRCQRLRFHGLPADVLDGILRAHDVPAERRGAAVALAHGSGERALALAEEGVADALLEMAFRVDDVTRGGRVGDYVETAEALAGGDITLSVETLVTFYRDLAAAALGAADDRLAFRHVASEIRSRGESLGARRASARVASIAEVIGKLERNMNPRVTMDALLFGLRDAR